METNDNLNKNKHTLTAPLFKTIESQRHFCVTLTKQIQSYLSCLNHVGNGRKLN